VSSPAHVAIKNGTVARGAKLNRYLSSIVLCDLVEG
jgi:hypothetical protein